MPPVGELTFESLPERVTTYFPGYADMCVALTDGTIRARGAPEVVVTEDLLAEVFHVDAEVVHTDRGPKVTPIRARHEDDAVDRRLDE